MNFRQIEYGGTLNFDITVALTNQSFFNNPINNIYLALYLPNELVIQNTNNIIPASIVKFSENNENILETEVIDENKMQVELINTLTYKNINQFQTDDSIGLIKNNGSIEKYINGIENERQTNIKKQVVLIKIDNTQNQIKMPMNSKILFNLKAKAIASKDTYNTTFCADAEIVSYSNSAFRRLMYKASGIGYVGVVVGNKTDTEKDYALSNRVQIIPPTGTNKNMRIVYLLLIILLLLLIPIVHNKKNNK